jgi:hypothetical protein
VPKQSNNIKKPKCLPQAQHTGTSAVLKPVIGNFKNCKKKEKKRRRQESL